MRLRFLLSAALVVGFPSVVGAQTNHDHIFRNAFPQCFELFPDESIERAVCLDVSAMTAATKYSDDQLRAAVESEIKHRERRKREEVRREQQQERQRADAEKAQKAREKAASERRAERTKRLSDRPLGVYIDSWRLGGFGTVFLATITLQNNSDRRMADFVVACETYANSGTKLSSPSMVLYEALGPGQRGTFEVNLGAAHSQSSRANCSARPTK